MIKLIRKGSLAGKETIHRSLSTTNQQNDPNSPTQQTEFISTRWLLRLNQQTHQQTNKKEKFFTDFQFSKNQIQIRSTEIQQTESQRNSAISTKDMNTTNLPPLKMKLRKEEIQEILKFASIRDLQRLLEVNPTGKAQDIIGEELRSRLQEKNFNPTTEATTSGRKDWARKMSSNRRLSTNVKKAWGSKPYQRGQMSSKCSVTQIYPKDLTQIPLCMFKIMYFMFHSVPY